MLFDFYVKPSNSKPSISDINNSKLLIYKSQNAKVSNTGIINNVISVIKNYFSKSNNKLGQMIDINQLSTDIINLDGVDSIKTYRSDTNTYVDGISFLVWNYTYPNLDVNTYSNNFNLQSFQYPVFNNISNLINRISVVSTTGVISVTDY